jgi:predicted oxidoreductase (fatty acid repression mutant protein)
VESHFFDAVRNRRTYYSISNETIVPYERIREIVNEAVKHTPSSFNSQSARVVLLLGKHHERLWDIVKAELKKIVPADKFKATEDKIDGAFRSGYGTVLYFEDMDVIGGLQERFPSYRDNFPVWSNHSAGMLQFVVWTALELEGLGASLQHYNPVIDDAVKAEWGIPASWKLLAQMPFGKAIRHQGEKEFKPLEERVRVFE